MKDYTRNVSLLCPTCGNDQFEDLGDDKYKCSDCNGIYTKEELIENNQAIIQNHVDEMADDIIKDIAKDLKRIMK